MARYRFPNQIPPRGWFYIQAESKLRIEGESLEDLIRKVTDHRKYKGLSRVDPDEVRLDIERQVCTRLTARECVSEGIDDEWKPIEDNPNITMAAVIGFSRVALE